MNYPGVQLPGVILESYAALLKNQNIIAADTAFQEIICSFDPNDKMVMPAGQGPAKEVLGTDNLTYTIRFQNTGNDTVFFVMLIDTSSTVLDMNTFEFIGSSHPVSLSCSMSDVEQFRFGEFTCCGVASTSRRAMDLSDTGSNPKPIFNYRRLLPTKLLFISISIPPSLPMMCGVLS